MRQNGTENIDYFTGFPKHLYFNGICTTVKIVEFMQGNNHAAVKLVSYDITNFPTHNISKSCGIPIEYIE